jgi:hypothetical protein
VPDNISVRHAQPLLRLAGLPEDELRSDLRELKLPLVLLQDTPEELQAYQDMFAAPVTFNSDHYAFDFDPRDIAL